MKKIQKINQPRVFTALRYLGGLIYRTQSRKKSDSPDWDSLPKLMSIRSTAMLLNVHPNTLRKWDQQGRLPAVRLGSRQDRRYERHRVQELWHAARRTPGEAVIARMVKRQNNLFFFRRRWLRPLAVATTAVIAMVTISRINLAVASQPVPPSVTFAGRDCSGWQKPQNAERINLADQALPSEFNSKNSAQYDVNNYRVQSRSGSEVATGNLDAAVGQFGCAGFTANDFPGNSKITRATLVVSFFSQAVGNEPDGFILETSRDGKIWVARGVISTRTEKPGRLSYDLGTGFDREALANLRVRLTPDVDIATPSTAAWLDGIAIQADIVAPAAVDKKKNAEAEQDLNKLVTFSRAAYASTETPILTVPKQRMKKFMFFTTDKEEWTIDQVEISDQLNNKYLADYGTAEIKHGASIDSQLTLNTARLHPGKYNIKITMVRDKQQTITINKEVLWGVVALNVTRAIAGTDSEQVVGMAVLDDNGKTICDAAITLTVTDPRGKKTTYTTKNDTVQLSHKCVDKGVTNEPDYFVKLKTAREGLYHLHFEATTGSGQRTSDDTFTVDNSVRFDVNRFDFPTRLYPLSPYTVRLAITAKRDYKGIVQERAPKNFALSELQPSGNIKPSSDDPESQTMEWSVDWKKNETYYFSYTFKPPEISPALFALGPLQIISGLNNDPDFQEPRLWQLASDSIAAALTRFTPTSGATITQGAAITKGATVTDSYRATQNKDGTTYSVNGSNSGTTGYEVHLNYDNVTLSGANKMILDWSAANGTGFRKVSVQICDWASATGVDSAADSYCTGGGWRTINNPSGTNLYISQAWRKNNIFDGLFYNSAAPTTALSTPLTNFVNPTTSQVKIRFYNTDSDTQAFNLDAAQLEVAIDPQYYPSGVTAINNYPMSVVYGYYSYPAVGDAYTVNNDADNAMDYYYSFKNIQTYTGANTVLVNFKGYNGLSDPDPVMTYNLGIYNFNSSSWEDLHTGQITDIGAQQDYFAKSNVTLSNYISGGEARIRVYTDVKNTATFVTSGIYIVIGSVNADNTKSETSFGKPNAGSTSVTSTRDLDVVQDDGTAASVWKTTPCKNNSDSGCATVPNAMDFASTYNSRYSASANVSVPITVPTSGTVTGVYYAARFKSNYTTITAMAGLRDYGGTYGTSTSGGGWVDLSTTGLGTIPTGTTASNASTTHTFFDGYYQINPASMIDQANNLANMRLRTSASTRTTAPAAGVDREWDFAMMSIRWVNGPSTKQVAFAPTAENLVAGTKAAVGASSMTTYRGAFNNDSKYVVINDTSGTTDIDYQLSFTGVNLLGANKINFLSKWMMTNGTDAMFVQICDWQTSTGVDAAADANCGTDGSGGWRTITNPKSTGSIEDFSSAPVSIEIYDGYFYTGTGATAAKISTPLSNFVNSGTVKIRFFSGDRLTDVFSLDQAQINVAIDPVYYPDSVSANSPYELSVSSGEYANAIYGPTNSNGSGLVLNNNAVNPIDTTFTFSNVRTYPGANAILLQAWNWGQTSASMGINFSIYNYSTASWEDLHTGMLTSTYGRTDQFAKSNVNLRDYISYPPATPFYGQIKIRAYSETYSTDTMELKFKLVVGSVNADASKSEISYGQASPSDPTNTRNLDTGGSDSTFDLTACKNSTDSGCAGSKYNFASTSGYNSNYNFEVNIGVPITAPANSQVTGVYSGNRFNTNSMSTGYTVFAGPKFRDFSGQLGGGWPVPSAAIIYTTDAQSYVDAIYTANVQNLIDTTNNIVYIGSSSSTVITEPLIYYPKWDFAMAALSYVLTETTITVSGNVYSDDATSVLSDCNSARNVVALRVAGQNQSPVSCAAADGAFTVTNVPQPAAGDVMFFWLTGVSSKYGSTAVSYSGSSNVTSVKIRQNRLVLRSDYGSLTNSGLNAWQNSSDSDMVYSVAGGNLTTESGIKLVVDGGTFEPGGTVTTNAASDYNLADGDVGVTSGATLSMGTNSLLVGGDFTNAGTLTLSSGQTTTMKATGAGFTITSGGQSLKGLTLNGSGGGWTNSGNLTVSENWIGTAGGFTQANSTIITVNGAVFSLANGFTWTKAASGNNLILENAGLTFTDSNATKQNLGAVQIGASPGVVTLASDMSADTVTIPASDTLNTKGYDVTTTGAFACNSTCVLDLTDAGGSNEGDGTILDVGGDFTMSATGTLTPYTNSTLKMGGGSKTLTLNGKAIYNFEETGGSVAISGATTVNNNLTITSGTLTAPSATTLTIGGNYSNSGTFTHNGGTIVFNSTATGKTITPGSSGLNYVTFNGSGGEWTIKANLNASGITMAAGTLKSDDVTTKVSGNIDGTAGIINMTSGTFVQYVYDATLMLGTTSGSNNWTFNNLSIACPYDDSGGNAATNSGGSGAIIVNGTLLIGPVDPDAAGSTLSNSGNRAITVNNFETVTGSDYVASASAEFTVTGNWTNAGSFTPNSGTVKFTATDAGHTIAPGPSSFYNLIFDGSGGGWTMSDTTTVSNNLTITNGSLTAPASLLVGGNFTNAGTFVEGTGTVTLNGTASTTLNSGCSDTDSCTTKNFYNLIVNKTDGDDADDNITLTTNGINVANTLTITDGELVQGALNIRAEGVGGSAVSIAAGGKLSNISTGDIKIGGTFANAGTLYLDNQGNSSGCLSGDTDDISFISTTTDVRALSGAGTFTLYDVSADYLNATVAITVNGGTDGGHNTGSWTFNGCGIIVSGTCDQYDQSTDCSDDGSNEIRVAVNGSLKTEKDTTVDGSWSISSVPGIVSGDIITVFINTNTDANEAVAVTKYDGTGDITGVVLFQRHLTIGSDDNPTITNADLGQYDNSVSGDEDVFHEVTAGNDLIVDYEPSGTGQYTDDELYIKSGATYRPAAAGGADATTTNVELVGTWIADNNSITVGGGWVNSGTFNANTSTLSMTGSGKEIKGSVGTTFNNLTISDSTTVAAGGSDQTVAGTLNVNSDKTLAIATGRKVTILPAGTLTLGGTISGASSTDGTLVYQSTTTFPTGGTISAPLQMDATNNDQSMSARTYGGQVEIYNNSNATARTVTLFSSSPYTFSSNLHIKASGTKDVALDANANNPAVNIAGDLDFTGSGAGTELIASGSGTWTVSGNANLTDGYFAPSYVEISPSWNRIAKKIDTYDEMCSGMTTYNCDQSGLEIGFDDQSQEQRYCPAVDTRLNSAAKYPLTSIDDGATIISTELVVSVTNGNTSSATVSRYATDAPNNDACDESATGLYSRSGGTGGTTVASPDWSSGGLKRVQLSATENGQIKSRLIGSEEIAYGFTDPCANGICPPTTTTANLLRVGYTTSTTSTLVMNGASATLTPGGNSFYNLTISGHVTLANENFFISGNLDLTGSSLTGGTAIINLIGSSGTIKGGGQTVNQLKINSASGNGTITLTGSDITVGYYLRVDTSNTLTIDSGRVLTLTGNSLGLFGTISGNGDGRLTYTNAAGPSVDGTITAIFRYDASTNNITMAPRTYGGPVEVYSSRATSAVTLGTGAGSQNTALASTLTLSTGGSGTVNLTLDPLSGRSVTITGDTTIGSGATLTAASSGKTFNMNGDFTNNGTFTHNSGTVTLAGTSQQVVAGTLTGSTGKFNNLTVTNVSGDDPEASPSVIFASNAETAGTFTATTANTKLQFVAGGTYTFQNINLNGQTGTYLYLRSSSTGIPWNLNVAGTRSPDPLQNINVRDSNACGQAPDIDASDGTSIDRAGNTCWRINAISFSISGTNIGFGSCQSDAARYATGDGTGASSDSADAHTMTISTNARDGYSLTVYGPTLTSGANTIPAIGGTATASNPGTGQFGMRLIKNSGVGQVSSPYDTANWAYNGISVPDQIASHNGPASTTVYGARYICNINGVDTKPGSYSTDLTYVLSGTF